MKKLILSILGMSLLLLGSCSREDQISEVRIPDGKMRLSIEVAGLSGVGNNTRTDTRASVVSEEGENTINTLYLLFFDQQPDRSGLYLDYTRVPMPEESVDGTMGMNIDKIINFPSGLNKDGAYNILAIANIADGTYLGAKTVDEWMSQWANKTEREVMANGCGELPTGNISPSGLLMHGRMEKPEGEEQVHLLLARDLSRLDVTNEARAMYDLVTVSVWNAYTSTSIWEQGIMDYSTDVERVRRHYGVSSNDGADIKGGLYAFENQVSRPEDYDNVSTCLIIGMKSAGTEGPVTYYRVNMLSGTGVQQLRRNYVYNLVIEDVLGPGASTEEIAYLGESNKLIYTIGNWTPDVNGLIVEDDYSILSIPTKTVNMGKNGQKYEFKIHTFSSLPSPAPLTIRSQTYRPASVLQGEGENTELIKGINATLDGNTLVLESTTLDLNETERHGVLVLSFAGLELSMNVSQSGVHDDFLIVTEPDGGLLPFAAYAGIASGMINVQASGDWTARLYMSGFSFNSSTALSPVKIIESKAGSQTSQLVISDENDRTKSKFRVHTHSPNTGQVPREAFIVVELDKDPENYSSVIMLSQNFIKQMYLWLPGTYPVGGLGDEGNSERDPDRKTTSTATFNGMGTGLVTGLTGNSDTFIIGSPLDEGQIVPWYSILVPEGPADDTEHFEIIEGEFSPAPSGEALYDRTKHVVKVKAKGMNISGRNYQAVLRAQVDPGTYVEIHLVQHPAEWNLPASLPRAIAAAGGDSAPLLLDAPAGMHYTVEIESFAGASDHFAYVKDPNDATNIYSKLQPKGVSEPFIVGFPKLIYPNLYSPASAIVKVTIVESGQSKSFTILQMPPAQKTVNIFNVGMDWGGLSNASNKPAFTYTPDNNPGSSADNGEGSWYGWYCGAWARNFNTSSNFGNTTTSKVKITTSVPGLASAEIGYFATVWPDVKGSTSMVHFTRPGESTSADWNTANSTLWEWINGTGEYAGNEGVMVVNAEAASAESAIQFNSTHVPGMMGLTGGHQDAYTWQLSSENNRLMNYFTKTGPFGEHSNMSQTWSSSGTSSYIDISSVQSIPHAVPVLVGSGGTWCSMMVDPVRRIVVKSDSEMVRQHASMEGFGQNLQAWIINTAQYGSHFSEYFWDSPRYLMTAPVPQE